MADQKLIFYGKQIHVLIQGHMFGNRKILIRTLQPQDAGDAEIAVIFLVMTPADEVPAESIKYQSYGFLTETSSCLLVYPISRIFWELSASWILAR